MVRLTLNPTGRRIAECRNRLWIAWMRLPWRTAWAATRRLMDSASRGGVNVTTDGGLRAELIEHPFD